MTSRAAAPTGLAGEADRVLAELAVDPRAPVSTLVRAVQGRSGIRLVATATGEANLVVSAVLRSVAEVPRFEAALGAGAPEGVAVRPVRTLLLGRPRKRMGWVLDETGRRTDDLVLPEVLQLT